MAYTKKNKIYTYLATVSLFFFALSGLSQAQSISDRSRAVLPAIYFLLGLEDNSNDQTAAVIDPPAIVGTITPVDLTEKPTEEEAASFLMAASFGPTKGAIDQLVSQGYSDWFTAQKNMPIDYILPDIDGSIFGDTTNAVWETLGRSQWYDRAVNGPDQLRQRAAFALSQIFVVSHEPRDWLFKAHLQATYMDVLQEGAFGNFRDLMEDVTYSPLMGLWLTYIGNEKANLETGSMPDENYAREIMQLFTIGLVDLENNGQPKLTDSGEQTETYTLEDISGLSKVFTGLWWANKNFGFGFTRISEEANDTQRMVMHDEYHSPQAKTFLGHTIPAGTGGDESIRQALNVLFEHDNVGPFISKQLIKRMTTSNPTAAYVERVAEAFNTGRYTLPDDSVIGTGKRGDMTPVWAAILFDEEARNPNRFNIRGWGKVREPIIRFIHWARVAQINDTNVLGVGSIQRGGALANLSQDPFRSPSVFNFYRPGFVAGGTLTGDENLVAPELQITTSATAIQYPNFMAEFVLRDGNRVWTASYAEQLTLVDDHEALTDYYDLVMTAGRMSARSKELVSEVIPTIGSARDRAQLSMLLVVNSAEFNTQQ